MVRATAREQVFVRAMLHEATLVEDRQAWEFVTFERAEDAPAFLAWQPQPAI